MGGSFLLVSLATESRNTAPRPHGFGRRGAVLPTAEHRCGGVRRASVNGRAGAALRRSFWRGDAAFQGNRMRDIILGVPLMINSST